MDIQLMEQRIVILRCISSISDLNLSIAFFGVVLYTDIYSHVIIFPLQVGTALGRWICQFH